MGFIYVVRHGENRANVERVFSHRVVDYPLTERSVGQALAVAEWLAGRPLACVYTSPLLRARQAADHIARAAGARLVEVEALRELAVGTLDGRSDPFAWALYKATLARWRECDRDARFPGGESFREAHERLAGYLHDVVDRRAAEDVAVVGHGGLFCAVLPRLCAVPGDDGQAPLEMANTSVTLLRQSGAGLSCERWAALKHLVEV